MLNGALEIEKELNENNETIKKSNYFILKWSNWVRFEKSILLFAVTTAKEPMAILMDFCIKKAEDLLEVIFLQ